jgi:5-methylcytosine-specific restriction endonuclease McrA
MTDNRGAVRQKLMEMQGGACHYCKRTMTIERHPKLMCTIDHVVPQAHGGEDTMANYVGACSQCNNARGTIPSRLFARFVRRFGVTDSAAISRSRRRRLVAIQHMRANGLAEDRINDVMRAKLEQWLSSAA